MGILSIFPGYRGYKNKEALRETDRIVRESLYNSLKDNAISQMRSIFSQLIASRHQDSQLAEQIILKLDRIAEKIRHAEYGYEPSSSIYHVREKELKKLTEFDRSLATHITNLLMKISFLKNQINTGNLMIVHSNLIEIDQLIDSLETVFNTRKHVMLNL